MPPSASSPPSVLAVPLQSGAGNPLGDIGSHEIIAAKPGTILRVWPQVGGSVDNATRLPHHLSLDGNERRAHRRLRRGAVSRYADAAGEARRRRLGASDDGRRGEVRADPAAGFVGDHRRHRRDAGSRIRHRRHRLRRPRRAGHAPLSHRRQRGARGARQRTRRAPASRRGCGSIASPYGGIRRADTRRCSPASRRRAMRPSCSSSASPRPRPQPILASCSGPIGAPSAATASPPW